VGQITHSIMRGGKKENSTGLNKVRKRKNRRGGFGDSSNCKGKKGSQEQRPLGRGHTLSRRKNATQGTGQIALKRGVRVPRQSGGLKYSSRPQLK